MVATLTNSDSGGGPSKVLVFTRCGYKLYMGAVNGHGPVQVVGMGAR